NTEGMARSLWLQALGSFMQGGHTKAHPLLTESPALSKELQDKRGTADALAILAYIAFHQGEPGRMRDLPDEALALRRAVGDRRGFALSLATSAVCPGREIVGHGKHLTRGHWRTHPPSS